MRPKSDKPKKETFSAIERARLASLHHVVSGAKGKSKQAAKQIMAGLSQSDLDLMARWFAYRLGGGI